MIPQVTPQSAQRTQRGQPRRLHLRGLCGLRDESSVVRQGGFTLIEVLVALLIIASTILVLLDRRNDALGDASFIRERRLCWVLAAQKMGEIEMEKELFVGDGGGGDEGNFEDDEGYWFKYTVEKREEATNDPEKSEEEPKTIFYVELLVKGPSMTTDEDAVKLAAYFPELEAQDVQK